MVHYQEMALKSMYDKLLFCILLAPLKTSRLQTTKQTCDGWILIAYGQGSQIQDIVTSIAITNLCLIEGVLVGENVYIQRKARGAFCSDALLKTFMFFAVCEDYTYTIVTKCLRQYVPNQMCAENSRNTVITIIIKIMIIFKSFCIVKTL